MSLRHPKETSQKQGGEAAAGLRPPILRIAHALLADRFDRIPIRVDHESRIIRWPMAR